MTRRRLSRLRWSSSSSVDGMVLLYLALILTWTQPDSKIQAHGTLMRQSSAEPAFPRPESCRLSQNREQKAEI